MAITGTRLNNTPEKTISSFNIRLEKPPENSANNIVSMKGLNASLARPQSKVDNLIKIAQDLPASEIKFTTAGKEDLSKMRFPQNSNLKSEDLSGKMIELNGGVKIAEVKEIVGNGGLANVKGEEPFRIESKDYRALVNEIKSIEARKSAGVVA